MAAVLLVEPDASIRMLLVAALGDEGHAVKAADSWAEALAAANTARLAVVSPAARTPAEWDAGEAAALATLARALPTVLLTTAPDAFGRRIAGLGLAAVVAEPFDLEALLATVAALTARLPDMERQTARATGGLVESRRTTRELVRRAGPQPGPRP